MNKIIHDSKTIDIEVEDDKFELLSDYLHGLMIRKEYITTNTFNSVILPQEIIVYPESRFKIIKPVLEYKKLTDIVDISSDIYFSICKEFLQLLIILNRISLDFSSISIEELYVGDRFEIYIDILPDNFQEILNSGIQETKAIKTEFIENICLHNVEVLNIESVIKTLSDITYKFFEQNQAEIITQWFTNTQNSSQLLAIVIYIEECYRENLPEYVSIYEVNDIFNPFNKLLMTLEEDIAEFANSDDFLDILWQIELNTLLPKDAQEKIKDAVKNSLQIFINSELRERSQYILQNENILYETAIEPKVIRIVQSKYQQQQTIELIEKFFNSTLKDIFVTIEFENTESIIEQICELVKEQSEITIFTKTIDLRLILENYLLELDTKEAKNAYSLAQIDAPSEEEKIQYNNIITKFIEEYIKIMHNCALYLGEIFPELLTVFNLEPDKDLQEFDCMEGGKYLIILLDHLIRPDLKKLFIFNETQFVLNQQSDLYDNILMSVLLHYSNHTSANSTLLHFQETEKFINQQEVYRLNVLEKIIKQAQVMSFEHRINLKILQDDFSNVISELLGENSYDSFMVASLIEQEECEKENYLCKYTELYDYILNSGFYYADIASNINEYKKLLFKYNKLEFLLSTAVIEVQKTIGISVDYFSFSKPCGKLYSIYLNIFVNNPNKVQFDILFILSICSEQLTIEELSSICNLDETDLESVCNSLVQLRFLNKVDTACYCIASLKLAEMVMQRSEASNYEVFIDKLFWLNISKYQIECTDQEEQYILFSELAREYYYIISTQNANYLMRRNSIISSESSFEEIDDISFSLISKLDGILSLSMNQSTIESESDGSDEFYAEYGIFNQTSEIEPENINTKETQQKLREITTELVKIKTCLLFVGCLNMRSKEEIEDSKLQLIELESNSYEISCILSTTAFFISEAKKICEDSEYSEYLETAESLETSCIMYYYLNISTKYSNILVNELMKRQLSNSSKAIIGWRMLKCGNIYDCCEYLLLELQEYINFQEVELFLNLFLEFQFSRSKYDALIFVISILNLYDKIDEKREVIGQKLSFLLVVEVLFVAYRLQNSCNALLALEVKLVQIGIQMGFRCQLLDISYIELLNWVISKAKEVDILLYNVMKLRMQAKMSELQEIQLLRDTQYLQDNQVIKLICMNGQKDSSEITNILLKRVPISIYYDTEFINDDYQVNNEEVLIKSFKVADFDYTKHIILHILGKKFIESLRNDQLGELEQIQLYFEILIRLSDQSAEANVYSIISQIVESFDSKLAPNCVLPYDIVIGRGRVELYSIFERFIALLQENGNNIFAYSAYFYFYKPYCIYKNRLYEALHFLEFERAELLQFNTITRVEQEESTESAQKILSAKSLYSLYNSSRSGNYELQVKMVKLREVNNQNFEEFIFYWTV